MIINNIYTQDRDGNAIADAQCYITNPISGDQIQVFDINGIGITQPISSDSNGLCQFKCSSGNYFFRMIYGLIDTTTNISIYNSDDQDFQILKRSYAEAGLNLVDGSFQIGGSLSGWTDVLWDWSTGKGYQWHLDESKVVSPGSIPTNIGTDWFDKSSVMLRSLIENGNICNETNVTFIRSNISDFIKKSLIYRLSDSVSILEFMTKEQADDVLSGAGTISISDAWQKAVNYAKTSSSKLIMMPAGTYLHTVPLDVTTSACNGIAFVCAGARKAAKILCGTGGWAIDLSGAAWTKWSGIYLIHASTNPSTGAVLLGGTAEDPECLYHDFDNDMIELYNKNAPSSFGTIGFAVIGSEENTFHSCNVVAETPYLFSTSYASISADYPSPYQTIQASHSCGVNTFSGENTAITYDKQHANVSVYGANSIDFGNIYMSDIEIDNTRSKLTETCISFMGGTIDAIKGHIKVEHKSTLAEYAEGEYYDIELSAEYGAGTTQSNPVLILPSPTGLIKNKYINNDYKITYYDPTVIDFVGKHLIYADGVSGASGNQEPIISNFSIIVNQDSGITGSAYFPAQFCGVANNCNLTFTDMTYQLNINSHIKKLAGSPKYIGVGNGVGDVVGKIFFPQITSGFGARSVTVEVSGSISSINQNSGASETLVTTCNFDIFKSIVSGNDGALITTPSGEPSGQVNLGSSTALSTDPSLALYSGVYMDLNAYSNSRYVDVVISPKGSGSGIAGVLAFILDCELKIVTTGRKQELIYIQ